MRLIDADALIDDLKHDVAMDQDSLDYEELTDLNREKIQFDKDCKQNAIDLLQHAPTIEPEIVRCKDCRYMTEHYDTDGNVPYWTCSEWDSGTDYDGFCHYAERGINETD